MFDLSVSYDSWRLSAGDEGLIACPLCDCEFIPTRNCPDCPECLREELEEERKQQ